MSYYGAYLYYNNEYFVSDVYGEQSVSKGSEVTELLLQPTKPIWFDFDYRGYELNDKTDLFQFGGAQQTKFYGPTEKKNFLQNDLGEDGPLFEMWIGIK